MNKILKESFMILIISLSFIYLLNFPTLQAIELDLASAQDAVGKRFASKFCEAKQEGFSSESSSEFALNNTYLKFASFPEDEKFVEDLWVFTIGLIRNDCGEYVTNKEEKNLRDFFVEEGKIASNRNLYLPH